MEFQEKHLNLLDKWTENDIIQNMGLFSLTYRQMDVNLVKIYYGIDKEMINKFSHLVEQLLKKQ